MSQKRNDRLNGPQVGVVHRFPPVQKLGPYNLAANDDWQDVTNMSLSITLTEVSHIQIMAEGKFICTAAGAENFITFLKVVRNPLGAGYADHAYRPDAAETIVATGAADWYTDMSHSVEWTDCAVGVHLFKMQACEILQTARTRKLYHTVMIPHIIKA